MKDINKKPITEQPRETLPESIRNSNRQSLTNEADVSSAFSRQVSENQHLTRTSVVTSKEQRKSEQWNLEQRRMNPQRVSVNPQKDVENAPANGRKASRPPGNTEERHPNKWADRDRIQAGRNLSTGVGPGAVMALEEQKKQQPDEMGQTYGKRFQGHNTGKGPQTQKEKAKTKRVKVQANRLVLHESMVNSLEGQGATHYGGKAATTKNRGQRASMSNVFAPAAQPPQVRQGATNGVAQPASPKRRHKQPTTQVESDVYDFKAQTQPYLIDLMAGQGQGNNGIIPGNATGGNASRRKLVAESSASRMQQQKASGPPTGSQNNSLKRKDPMRQTTYNQYYMSQRKDLEGNKFLGNQHISKHVGKHLRKNQPVPIDTFNIVSNRRQSLVKIMNEANATSVAMLGANSGHSVVNSSINGGGSMVTIDANQQNDLVLPQIQPNSKSGLLHYHPNNQQTPAHEGFKKMHANGNHTSTLKSVELQGQTNPSIYSTISPNNNGGSQVCVQSMDNKFDIHRRTTASIFPKANNASTNPLSPPVNNNSGVQSTPLQRNQPISTKKSNNHVSKRIQNIVSPIQAVKSSQGAQFKTMLQKQREDLMPMPGMESPQPSRRRPAEEFDGDPRFMATQDQQLQHSTITANEKKSSKTTKKDTLQNVSDGQYFQLQQKRGSDVAVTDVIQHDPAIAAEDICDQTISRIPKSHGRNSGGGKILQTDGIESKDGVPSIDKSGGVDFLSLTENQTSQASKPINFVTTPDFELDNNKPYKGNANRPLLQQQQINSRKSQTVVTAADGPYEYIAPTTEDGIQAHVSKTRDQNCHNSANPASTQQPRRNRHATTGCQGNSSMYSGTHSSSDDNEDGEDDGGSDQDDDQASDDQVEEPMMTEWVESVKSLHPQPQDSQETLDGTKEPGRRRGYQFDAPMSSALRVTEQLNSRHKDYNQGSVPPGKLEKRKQKKSHRRQNTHHHYHIDFNFEQVNNILVSYGGVGLQHQIKQYLKKDSSRANVSLSLGIVDPALNRTMHPKGLNLQASGAFGASNPGTTTQAASPAKKDKQKESLLPELTINKSKINFAVKQFKNADEAKLSNRQQRDLAQGHNNNPNPPSNQPANSRNVVQGQKSKRKKHKKEWNQTIQADNQRQERNEKTERERMPPSPQRRHPIDDMEKLMSSTHTKKLLEKNKSPSRQLLSKTQHPVNQQQPPLQIHPVIENRYPVESQHSSGQQILTLKPNQVSLKNTSATIGASTDIPSKEQQDPLDKHRKSQVSQASRHSKESKGEGSSQPANIRSRPGAAGLSQTMQTKPIQKPLGATLVAPQKHATNHQQSSAKREQEQAPQVNLSNQKPIPQSSITFSGNGTFVTNNSGAVGSKNTTIIQGTNNSSLKQRRQKHLHVITNNKVPLNNVVETPSKKQLNAKTMRSGPQVKSMQVEYHSAQLRPAQKRAGEVDDGAGGGLNAGALSQISSVISGENEGKKSPMPLHHGATHVNFNIDSAGIGSNRASAHPKSGAILPSRNPKSRSNVGLQERRLRQNNENNRKALRLLEESQSPTKYREYASAAELAAALMGSPATAREQGLSPGLKKVKPKITDFEIQECIGIGNFGEVHKAINKKEGGRVCALKALRKESVAQMKHVDHIINEREVLQFLQERNAEHQFQIQELDEENPCEDGRSDTEPQPSCSECPFLMGIYSSFQDKEHLYFELEYIEGCTLYSQIRKFNPVVQSNMPYYAAEVLLTLEYLHSHNIVYRDLKPENLVVSMTERGHIKLVDFGFAKRLKAPGQRTFTNCGTPAYIAPEVLLGHNGHGHEADIWSFGVLIVELVSGQTPFQADSTQEVYEKINACSPQYPKSITREMKDLLGKIFVPDPEVRMSLERMKTHKVFRDFDFAVPMRERFLNSTAPFIPTEPMFNEQADRDSEQIPEAKPKNILAAIMGNPDAEKADEPARPTRMSFDEAHYNKFERKDKRDGQEEGREESPIKRKRQNPLGDFKFVRINELF